MIDFFYQMNYVENRKLDIYSKNEIKILFRVQFNDF